MSAGLIGKARTSNTTSPALGAPTSGTSAQRRPSSGWPYRSSRICFIGSPPSRRSLPSRGLGHHHQLPDEDPIERLRVLDLRNVADADQDGQRRRRNELVEVVRLRQRRDAVLVA